jgi:cytochrome d ubiquinol oxidase subunit I
MEQERTRYGLEIPALGSLILTHSLHKQVPALKDFPKEDRPYSPAVFWSFRIMVGMGVLMIALGICSAWLRYRRRLYHSRPFQWFALCMGPAGLIALVAGWVTTEMGRQPWVIYGLLRTGRGVVAQHAADGHQPAGVYRGLLRRVWRGVLLHFPAYQKRAAAGDGADLANRRHPGASALGGRAGA